MSQLDLTLELLREARQALILRPQGFKIFCPHPPGLHEVLQSRLQTSHRLQHERRGKRPTKPLNRCTTSKASPMAAPISGFEGACSPLAQQASPPSKARDKRPSSGPKESKKLPNKARDCGACSSKWARRSGSKHRGKSLNGWVMDNFFRMLTKV